MYSIDDLDVIYPSLVGLEKQLSKIEGYYDNREESEYTAEDLAVDLENLIRVCEDQEVGEDLFDAAKVCMEDALEILDETDPDAVRDAMDSVSDAIDEIEIAQGWVTREADISGLTWSSEFGGFVLGEGNEDE